MRPQGKSCHLHVIRNKFIFRDHGWLFRSGLLPLWGSITTWQKCRTLVQHVFLYWATVAEASRLQWWKHLTSFRWWNNTIDVKAYIFFTRKKSAVTSRLESLQLIHEWESSTRTVLPGPTHKVSADIRRSSHDTTKAAVSWLIVAVISNKPALGRDKIFPVWRLHFQVFDQFPEC